MIRDLIHELLAKGWTKAALADECGVPWNTLDRWANGGIPVAEKLVSEKMAELLRIRRIPKGKRYTAPR